MYSSILSIGLMAGVALAQSAAIGLPQAGTQLSTARNTTFQIQRPDTLTGSEEIAVVIGINKCNEAGVCASPDESMGTVLYNGPFNPEFHEYNMPPYQNFSLLVPASAAAQQGIVTVAHFSLVGASAWPMVQYLNQTVSVV